MNIPRFKQIIILVWQDSHFIHSYFILIFLLPFEFISSFNLRKFNLRTLKSCYNSIDNLKSKHKLTDKNYKRFSIVARLLEWSLIKHFAINAIIGTSFCYFYLCKTHKTILPVILSHLLLILLVIVHSIFHSCTAFILITNFYYKSLFDQINDRTYFMKKFNFI